MDKSDHIRLETEGNSFFDPPTLTINVHTSKVLIMMHGNTGSAAAYISRNQLFDLFEAVAEQLTDNKLVLQNMEFATSHLRKIV